MNVLMMSLLFSAAVLGNTYDEYRDNTLQFALEHITEYCSDLPLAKLENSSYLCRLQVENDCLDRDLPGACRLLGKIKSWESRARALNVRLAETGKPSPYYSTRKATVSSRSPATGARNSLQVKIGTVDLTRLKDTDFVRGGNTPEDVTSFRRRYAELLIMQMEINELSVPVTCESKADCRVQGAGRRSCGGYNGAFAYSVKDGVPEVVNRVLVLNKHDQELQGEIRGLSNECHFFSVPEAQCSRGTCVLD